MRSVWGEAADRVLVKVFAFLAPDADDKTIRLAVRDAYPFGERKNWPYKVWLKRVKRWKLARRLGLTVPPEEVRRKKMVRDERQIDLGLPSAAGCDCGGEYPCGHGY